MSKNKRLTDYVMNFRDWTNMGIVKHSNVMHGDNTSKKAFVVGTALGTINVLARVAERAINVGEGGGRVAFGVIEGLRKGDWSQAAAGGRILKDEAVQTTKDMAKVAVVVGKHGCNTAFGVAEAGYGYYTKDKLAVRNGFGRIKRSLPTLAMAAAAGLVAHEIIHALIPGEQQISDGSLFNNWHQCDFSDAGIGTPIDTGHGYIPSVSVDTIPGVYQGVATHDAFLHITQLGELNHPHHITDALRNQAEVDVFLRQHGFAHTPEGYEVHHVIPISEGGADVPENMVLLPKDVHEVVTATHAKFYGWCL